jgi:hypothetical protein
MEGGALRPPVLSETDWNGQRPLAEVAAATLTGAALIMNYRECARHGDGTRGKLAKMSNLAASLNISGELLLSQWRAGRGWCVRLQAPPQ